MSRFEASNYKSINNLSKGVSEYEWSATAGQLTFVLPSGQTYDITSKWLEVIVGGAPIPDSQVQKDNSSQFTLLINSSIIQNGMLVVARWTQPYIPATSGHAVTHEIGGYDEIDVTKLLNYQEQIATPISNLSKGVSEYEWTAANGQLTYVLPNGQTYDTTSKWLVVTVGGSEVPDSLVQKDSSSQFTLLVNSSVITAGITVVARWTEPYIPATSGHHTTHELGGYDQIDFLKLLNFDTIYKMVMFPSSYSLNLSGLTIGNFTLPPFNVSLGTITLG